MSSATGAGTCELCRKSFRKSGMARHLKSCLARTGRPDEGRSEPGRRSRPSRSIHLVVGDAHRPEYWLHLDIPAGSKLEELDQYLRRIWVECCGHLSTFTTAGMSYDSHLDGYGKSMNVALGLVAPPGTKFSYDYDFGTTTELTLRSLAELDGGTGQIRLLARNDAPVIECQQCGATATQVGFSEDDWLAMTVGFCDGCALTAAPESEYLLPVVNSPRCGMCGYDGDTMYV